MTPEGSKRGREKGLRHVKVKMPDRGLEGKLGALVRDAVGIDARQRP